MIRTSICVSAVCLLICQQASAIDKGALLSTYQGKFVVVTKDGLSTALQSGLASGTLRIPINESGQAEQPKFIGGGDFNNSGISSYGQTGNPAGAQLGRTEISRDRACGGEPIRKGEVLKVSHVSLSGSLLDIDLTVPLHPAQCGAAVQPSGPIAVETGRTELAIQAGNGAGVDIPDSLAALAAGWLTPLGVTFADVEKTLGTPQARINSGDKVLYQYKDMTVEFRHGKVTDVR